MFYIIIPTFFLETTKDRGGWRHFHLLRHAKMESDINQKKVSCVPEDKMSLKPGLQNSWLPYGISRIKISHCTSHGLPVAPPWMKSISLQISSVILRAECIPLGTTVYKSEIMISQCFTPVIAQSQFWQCFIPLRYNWSQENPLPSALKLQETIIKTQHISFKFVIERTSQALKMMFRLVKKSLSI